MFDVAMLGVLTEATMPVLTKLHATVQVELEQQKKVGQAGGVSQDLQAILQEARQPLGALLEFMFDSDDVASFTPATVVPELTAVRKPKLSRRSLQSNRRGYRIFSIFSPSGRPEGYQPAIIGSTVELGEWDTTHALTLTPLNANPTFLSTSLLPAPKSKERVEFRWVFIEKDDADIFLESEGRYRARSLGTTSGI